jgi:acyl carrier protein
METEVRTYVMEAIERMTGSSVRPGWTDQTPLGYGGLELESLYLLELAVQVERRFAVSLGGDVAALPGYTLGDLVEQVTALAAAQERQHSRAVELDDIRALLAEQPEVFGGHDTDADAELAIDSLAAAWLIHLLHKRFGIEQQALEDMTAKPISIRRIHAFVADRSGRLNAPGHSS